MRSLVGTVILSAAKDQRSEASLCPSRETLRSAQGDNIFPILVGKNHNRASFIPPQ
jgi:hypothetical protein